LTNSNQYQGHRNGELHHQTYPGRKRQIGSVDEEAGRNKETIIYQAVTFTYSHHFK